MRLKISELKQIIQEEAGKVLSEYYPGYEGSPEQAGMEKGEREKSRASRKAAEERQAGHEASAENNAKMDRRGKADAEKFLNRGAKPQHLDDPSYKKAFMSAYKYAMEVAYSRKMDQLKKEREGMSDLNFIKKGRLQQKYKELSKQKRAFSNTFEDDTWMEKFKN